MNRLKTFLIYILIIVGVYILSNILIFIGLNVNYNPITTKSNIPEQISIQKAEATLVNGRIYGTITNNQESNANGKYIKAEIYSSKDKLLGTKYLTISNIDKGSTENFKIFFKAEDACYYNINLVDNVEQQSESLASIFLSEDLKKSVILRTLFYTLLF